MRPVLFVATLSALGCGSTGGGECDDVALTKDLTGGSAHVTCDLTCGNGQNPPTAGPHCGDVSTCRVHDSAQPRCRWLHNLEHGHVVLAYDCPEGCPEIVSGLTRLRALAKVGSNGTARGLVTPDPLLDRRVAAVVWGWSWTGDSADEHAIRCLMKHQDLNAPEPDLGCSP